MQNSANNIKTILKTLKILLTVLALIYLFYNFDFKKINYDLFCFKGIFFAFIFILISQFTMAYRWQKMTILSFVASLETIIVSNFLNMVLPARLGELSKILYPKKFYNFQISRGISTFFIERLFDIIILLSMMVLYFYLYFKNEILRNSISIFTILIVLSIMFFKLPIFLKILKKIPIQFLRVYSQKVYKNINKLLKNPLYIMFLTLLLWFFYFAGNYIFFKYGVVFHLSINRILEIFLFSTIALTLSFTPGGLATYEASIVFLLTSYGVNKEDAFIIAATLHLLIYCVTSILFILFFLIKDIKFKELLPAN